MQSRALSRRRRLVVGAGAALLALPSLHRHARSADADRFALGVASGSPRETGVVLWTRLTGPGLREQVDVLWQVAHDAAFTRIAAEGIASASARDAHAVHAEIIGLEASRWYFYRFEALGQRSPTGRTRTLPRADRTEPLRFAIASCQRWEHGHYAAWRHMANDDLDLVLFLGDYIYEYAIVAAGARTGFAGPAVTLDDYRARYALYRSDPLLRCIHAAQPWIVVWDDHEIANDYAAAQARDLSANFAARRAAATQAYWEHMPFSPALRPRAAALRIHARYDWGSLARLHMLDDRQYRDPQACPRPALGGGSNTVSAGDCAALLDARRSLLGHEQERWLAEGWDRERRWNLVAQQTLMSRFSSRDAAGRTLVWTDGWDGYPLARQRLLSSMVERGARNPVVLGGDFHAHVVADLKLDYDDPKSPVVAAEFCGTSISSRGRDPARIEMTRALHSHVHYARGDRRGYVRFELDEALLRADLLVLDDALDPESPIRCAARFVVEDGRPGPQRL